MPLPSPLGRVAERSEVGRGLPPRCFLALFRKWAPKNLFRQPFGLTPSPKGKARRNAQSNCKQQFVRPVPVSSAEKRPLSRWDRGRKIRGTTSNSAFPHENALRASDNASRCVGRTRPPLLLFQGGHSGRYFGALPCPLAPTGNSLEESGALTSSHHCVYRLILTKTDEFVKSQPTSPLN